MSDQKTRIIRDNGALDRGVRLNDTYEIDERTASSAGGELGIDLAHFLLSR
jgi:hypothetical protein